MPHAEIILTESVPHLGAEADVVKVRRGYARNFLLPQGKAIEVSSGSIKKINHLKAKRAEREGREVTAAEELASKINKLNLTFTLETGETGKAFGSITAKDIHDRLVKELNGIDLPKHAVALDKAIKESGEHEVPVKLHPDVTAKLHLHIASPKPVEVQEEGSSDEETHRAPRRKYASKS